MAAVRKFDFSRLAEEVANERQSIKVDQEAKITRFHNNPYRLDSLTTQSKKAQTYLSKRFPSSAQNIANFQSLWILYIYSFPNGGVFMSAAPEARALEKKPRGRAPR